MPVHSFGPVAGRIETITIDSAALRSNMLGDPASREVAIYLPPEYDAGKQTDFPLFVDIAGFTGSGLSHIGWKSFAENVPQRLERLVAEERMGPVVMALPDCFTSLGGNQYINSAAMGQWETFLIDEMIPAIEQRYRVIASRDGRAIFGKSSGGYGSIVHGLRHSDTWGAIACHSGDMAFEWVYLPDMPKALNRLAEFDRSIPQFLEHLATCRKLNGADFHVLMTLAMAATYDPDPDAFRGIRLPVDLVTCRRDEERWNAWLAHDPVRLVQRPELQENLRSLRGLYIDCGDRDQYHLHYGARQFVKTLEAAGIAHEYEEFDDDHSQVDYRLDRSLPFLYKSLMS